MTRRAFLTSIGLGACCSLGCVGDGHFSLLGYTTKPNYDENIRTVYVPIFENRVFQTGPYRGMEFQLTRAVIREIESRTPYKVVSDPDRADTELLGTVTRLNKAISTVHQQNEVRNLEYLLGAEIVWRDLRTGKVLTNPRPPLPHPGYVPPFDPTAPPPLDPIEIAAPVLVTAQGRVIPELGESSTTGLKMAIDQLAQRIVQMMEKPWDLQGLDGDCPPAIVTPTGFPP